MHRFPQLYKGFVDQIFYLSNALRVLRFCSAGRGTWSALYIGKLAPTARKIWDIVKAHNQDMR